MISASMAQGRWLSVCKCCGPVSSINIGTGLGLLTGIIVICFGMAAVWRKFTEFVHNLNNLNPPREELAAQLFWFMWVPGSVIIGVLRIVLPVMGFRAVDDVRVASNAMNGQNQDPAVVVATVAAVNPVAVATVVVPAQE